MEEIIIEFNMIIFCAYHHYLSAANVYQSNVVPTVCALFESTFFHIEIIVISEGRSVATQPRTECRHCSLLDIDSILVNGYHLLIR